MAATESKPVLFGSKYISTVNLKAAADMIRYNTLAAIYNSGSGHIGASFSAIEILTVLYRNIIKKGDTFVLSKGHAAASLYATLAGMGYFPEERLLTFRQLCGLPGHVDMSVLGVDANTGSLGMGISKAVGHALNHPKNYSYVMVGDGELQEGQNWEAIMSAAHMKLGNLVMIVDRNTIQTDKPVSEIIGIEPLEQKLQAFGWSTVTVDGHSIEQVAGAFDVFKSFRGDFPKAIICDTLKGYGVSFMRSSMVKKGETYKWHNGISTPREYADAVDELIYNIQCNLSENISDWPTMIVPEHPEKCMEGSSLKSALSRWLMKCLYVRSIKNLVVLDADLSEDCGLREFEKKFPERFIQCGIAEQNMVSIAGSMPDKLPVVNTYAAFLTSRANEQIFNNCSQHSKVIYAGHLAGLLPGRPGKSHQAVRDISLLMSIPNLTLFAPCNGVELDKFLSWAAKDKDSSYVRIEHAPARHDIKLPATYKFEMGKGFVLGAGHDVALITYGPLMLAECREAMYTLHKFRINARVINMPWLNCVDAGWLRKAVGPCKHVFVVENHSIHGGLSSVISKLMPVRTIGVIGFGQSGENLDVLKHYGLDFVSISNKVREAIL